MNSSQNSLNKCLILAFLLLSLGIFIAHKATHQELSRPFFSWASKPELICVEEINELSAWLIESNSFEESVQSLNHVFSPWKKDYIDLIDTIREEGYTIKPFNQMVPNDLDKPVAFIFYHVGLVDFVPTLGIIQSNINKLVPGTFLLQWDYTPIEEQNKATFLSLGLTNNPLISFGLEIDPISSAFSYSWDPASFIRWQKKLNDTNQLVEAAEFASEQYKIFIETPDNNCLQVENDFSWLNFDESISDDTNLYLNTVYHFSANARFSKIARSFSTCFPDSVVIAAMPTKLSAAVINSCISGTGLRPQWENALKTNRLSEFELALKKKHPGYWYIWKHYSSVGYLDPKKVQHVTGYPYELWNFIYNAPIVHVNDAPSSIAFKKRLLSALSTRKAIILTLKPYRAYNHAWK